MYTYYTFVKKLQELTTDEEILEFVKDNVKDVTSFDVGDKIGDNEYFVLSFNPWYFEEYPEEVQELVNKIFPGRVFTEEEIKKIYNHICNWMNDNTDDLPSSLEYLEFVLNSMKYDEAEKNDNGE